MFGPDQQQGGGGAGGRGGGFPFGQPRIASVPDTDQAGKVTAAAADKSNTLVVTAPPAIMKVIKEILDKLDADPAAMSQVSLFQLKFADADSAAKLINTIYGNSATGGTSTQTQTGGAGGRFNFGGGGGGGGGGGRGGGQTDTSAGAKIYVNAVSDERTNTVVVTAPSDAMRIITNILEKLDSNPSAESALFIYHLKNGVAADIQQTLNALFSTSTSGGSTNNSNTNRSTSGQSLTSSTFGSSSGFGGGGGGGRGVAGVGSVEAAAASAEAAAPASDNP